MMRVARHGCLIATVLALLGVAALPARAQTTETIVRALQMPLRPAAQPVTRSFQPGSLQPAATRGIAVEGGDTGEPAPSIDLYVPFEYDQSSLTLSDARLVLDALGKALRDPRLSGTTFEIIGHTDARGTDDYNMQLSRRRAEAVRAYLVQFHGVERGRLKAEGRGRRELKDPARPEDGINRRVQVLNIGAGVP